MSSRRIFRLLVTVLATVLTAATAAFAQLPADGAAAPSFSGKGPAALQAGAAEGLIRVPIGTPLGGYLRPPVGGDLIGPDPFGEATDVAPTQQADDGTPLAPLPDEARAAHSPYATYSPPSRGYYDALTVKAVALDDGEDVAVLLKADLIGALDEVTLAVADAVHARTGVDVS
jgi:neutral ceramidase